MLITGNQPLSEAGEHYQQAYTPQSKAVCYSPKEDEQSGAEAHVFNPLGACVRIQALFKDTFRNGLSGSNGFFYQFVTFTPILVAEVKRNEDNKNRETEN